jgi:hypothetical protein
MYNEQSSLDSRKVLTGKDGQLYVTPPDSTTPIFLGEVDSFSVQVTFNNVDHQPVGSNLVYSINTGYSMVLSMSEVVIRDDVMLDSLIKALNDGYAPVFDFRGQLTRRIDGQLQQQVFRNCIPQSNVDLMNVAPGDIVKRTWSFRVNAAPEIMNEFAS